MKSIRGLAVAIAFIALLSGCANIHTERHFDRSPEGAARAREVVSLPNRATVYFFRERAWMQELVYTPIPPMFYVVDEQMLSVMPLGSHVVLSLAPGTHTFKSVFVNGRSVSNKLSVTLNLEAGGVYFVGARNFSPFGQVEAQKGREIVAETELAKLIHQPVSLSEFRARVARGAAAKSNSANAPTNEKPKTANAPIPVRSQGNGTTTSWSDILPSAKQVSGFLEGLAAVALIGLVAYGAAQNSAANAPIRYPSTAYQTPPAIVQQSPTIPIQPVMTWRGTDGTLSEILQSKSVVTIQNTSTGTQYRVENGRISGTDGSYYQIYGSTIVSSTGQSYQVVGNNLFASDGRTCTKVGNNILCD